MSENHEMAQSLVFVYQGPRGSGKTVSLVADAAMEMINGVKVWANFPIGFNLRYNDGRVEYFESLPLTMDALYAYSDELRGGIVCLDELNLWVNARQSMSVKNRLINGIFTLIRKRQLSILISCQNFMWLDNQIRWQTDALVTCRDLRFILGKYLRPGQFITQRWQDMSGLLTGYSYDESPRDYSQRLWGELFWGTFNSWQEFDILDAMRSVRVAQRQKVLRIEDFDKVYDSEPIVTFVQELANSLRDSGQSQILVDDMRKILADAGYQGDNRVTGKLLKQAGFQYRQTRRGNFYQLAKS